MKEIKLIVFGSLLILGVEALYFQPSFVKSKDVALPTPSVAPTLSPSPSPASTPTLKPTPKPSPTPSPMAHQEVNELISKYASQYGLDPNVMRHMALCESGFKSNAKNGPYIGLFQFDVITWKNIRRELNLNTDPALRYSSEESIKTAFYALSKGKTKLWPNCVP